MIDKTNIQWQLFNSVSKRYWDIWTFLIYIESGITYTPFDTFFFIIIYLRQLKIEMICVADIQAVNH